MTIDFVCIRSCGIMMAAGGALALVATPVFASPAPADRPPPFGLESLSKEDVQLAGVGGTGCSWSRRPNDPHVLAMSDDLAIVKVEGRAVLLKPAADAKDLFPFTHDRWRASALTIRITRTGKGASRGDEAWIANATLRVDYPGGTYSIRGFLVCGS